MPSLKISGTLVYGFESNLSKNQYFFTYTIDKIPSRCSREDLIQKTLYQTETPIFLVHQFLKKNGNRFSRITNFENFARIDFRELTLLRIKKGIRCREFGQNSRNFLAAKISVHVLQLSQEDEFSIIVYSSDTLPCLKKG